MNTKNNERGKLMRQKMLDFIIRYIGENCYPPSVREIGEACGMKSTSHVAMHLDKMSELGMIEMDDKKGTSRAIRVPGYKFVKSD